MSSSHPASLWNPVQDRAAGLLTSLLSRFRCFPPPLADFFCRRLLMPPQCYNIFLTVSCAVQKDPGFSMLPSLGCPIFGSLSPSFFIASVWRYLSSHQSTKSLMISQNSPSASHPTKAVSSQDLRRWQLPIVISQVCTEKERKQSTLWGSCAVNHHIRVTVTTPHTLWSFGDVVNGPWSQVADHSRALLLPPEQWWLYFVESQNKLPQHSTPGVLKVWRDLCSRLTPALSLPGSGVHGLHQVRSYAPCGAQSLVQEPLWTFPTVLGLSTTEAQI